MTTILNVKVDPRIKNQAKKVAANLGLNLSGIINAYLRELIRTETFHVSTLDETPTTYLIKAIREAERDKRAGRTISFNTPDEALAFLDTLKKKRRGRYAN